MLSNDCLSVAPLGASTPLQPTKPKGKAASVLGATGDDIVPEGEPAGAGKFIYIQLDTVD